MGKFRIRGRPRWQWVVSGALAILFAAVLLKPVLEHAVRARIESAAQRHGLSARIGEVHVGLWPLLRLQGLDVDVGHGVRFRADALAVTWPGRVRLSVRSVALAGPSGIAVSAPTSAWNVSGLLFGSGLRLMVVQPLSGLTIQGRTDTAGRAWTIEALGVDIGRLLDVTRDGYPLLEGGIADGSASLVSSQDALRFDVNFGVRGVRLGGLADTVTDAPQLGHPTEVSLQFGGAWLKARGAVDIPKVGATVAGARLEGALALRKLQDDPTIDLTLGVQKLDFAQMLGASGLDVPDSLGLPRSGSADLGTASIDLRVRGPLSNPAALAVSQKIAFRPPRTQPPGIARLRADFVFRAEGDKGPATVVDVSRSSPDFIAISSVPPLFVRTLLLAEDAGFYGHRGIDLRELPAALLTNWRRGTAARGASTISQQLAKNLFLSRDKQLGRKLQELAITFLLESALGKERMLEIYLNIIEWGPGLRGLRPAAYVYFGREPRALTPAQMAFLVSIIPGPIKYQASFASGTPGPGLRALVNDLLAKLRSVDAIGEEEYRRALAEPLLIGRGTSAG